MTSDVLDLDAFPARDRFDAWRVLADPFFEVSLPDGAAADFSGDVASFALGEALLIRSAVSGQHYDRDAARIRAGGWDQVAFQLYETGTFDGDYDGREVRAGPGDLNVIDFTRPYRKRSSDETDINLIVPRATVARLYPAFAHGTVLGPDRPRHHLLTTQLAALARVGPDLSPAEAQAAIEALLTLAAEGDLKAASPTARASARASLRDRAARFIRTHLLEPDLDPDRVCRACRVSRASLFRAFASDGGVLNYIRSERLHLAARRLRDRPDLAVGTVAHACGFLDLSQFSRQFRRAYGRSPSDGRGAPPAGRRRIVSGDPQAWLDTFRALQEVEPLV